MKRLLLPLIVCMILFPGMGQPLRAQVAYCTVWKNSTTLTPEGREIGRTDSAGGLHSTTGCVEFCVSLTV